MQCGTLYVVATPIGNLQDITQRALQILQDVALVAAEDTRHSGTLLQNFGINTRLLSLHEHNESQRAETLIAKLQQGEDIALISDAGTPLISDPGYNLVNRCREQGLKVVPIPGACAAIAALSASGLATDRFTFAGFLPVKAQARQNAVQQLLQESGTTVFYESPRRVLDTLKLFLAVLGAEREIVLAKELTKHFEHIVKGPAQVLIDWLTAEPGREKGEFVLLVSGAAQDNDSLPQEALQLMQRLQEDLPAKKAAAIVAEHYDLKKNKLYQWALDQKA